MMDDYERGNFKLRYLKIIRCSKAMNERLFLTSHKRRPVTLQMQSQTRNACIGDLDLRVSQEDLIAPFFLFLCEAKRVNSKQMWLDDRSLRNAH